MVSLQSPVRIATLNVRGLSDRRRQRQLCRLAVEQDLDIIAVQETKVESEDKTNFMVRPFTARYEVCVSHAVGSSAGCLLLVRQSLGATVEAVTTCALGRFVVCDFSLSSYDWRVICVYPSNRVDERRVFFDFMHQYCKSDRLIIFLGDFNCICSAGDKSSSTPYRDLSTESLLSLINESGLDDVGECLRNGREIQYTHFQGSGTILWGDC